MEKNFKEVAKYTDILIRQCLSIYFYFYFSLIAKFTFNLLNTNFTVYLLQNFTEIDL